MSRFCLFVTISIFSLAFWPAEGKAVAPDYARAGAIAIDAPTDVAVDGEENLYVVESTNNRLRIFNHAGILQDEILGLAKPLCVAVDSSGRIYIGNDGRDNVEVYGPNHSLLFTLGQGNGEISKPNDIKIDGQGDIYVVASESDEIRVYDRNGALRFSFGSTGKTDGLFNFPTALAIDQANQEVYVTDLQQYTKTTDNVDQEISGARIQVFTMAGIHQRSFGAYDKNGGLLSKPLGIEVDPSDNVYVVDSYLNAIQVYSKSGTHLTDLYNLDNSLATPLGIVLSDLTERLYIASLKASRVDIYGLTTSHTLTLTASAGGTVLTDTGLTNINHGEIITLTITPDSEYHIAQILVDGEIQPIATELNVVMTADHDVKVEFRPDTYTVTSSVIDDGNGTHGTISPSGTTPMAEGDHITFTFTPEENYQLAELLINDTAVSNVTGLTEYTLFNIRENLTVEARFGLNTFHITPDHSSVGGQLFIPNNGVAAYGENLSATITPYGGYILAELWVDGQAVPPQLNYTFDTITQNHTIRPVFEFVTLTISSPAIDGGSVVLTSGPTVVHGQSQTVEIVPLPGYFLVDVLIDGVSVGPVSQYVFSNITTNHVVEPIFTTQVTLVKPEDYIPDDPSTHPLLSPPGSVWEFQASNGSGTCNWTVSNSDGTVVLSAEAIGNAFSIDTETLAEQDAGLYTVAVVDAGVAGLSTDSMGLRLPLRLTPDIGSHADTDNSIDFTVSGFSGVFHWTILNEQDETLGNQTAFGTLPETSTSAEGAVTSTNSLTLSAPLLQTSDPFRIQARTDDPTLASMGLDTVVSGLHDISPGVYFKILVKDSIDDSPVGDVLLTTTLDDQVHVAATDENGYAGFLDLPNSGATYTFNVERIGFHATTLTASDPNVPITVFLEPDTGTQTFTIIAEVEPGQEAMGSTSLPGSGLVEEGGELSVTMTANEGYRLLDVLVDAISMGPEPEYTFNNVTGDHTIRPVFEPITYSFNATSDPMGTVSFSSGDSVAHGTTQVMTITPPTGYWLTNVIIDGLVMGPITEYTFTDVTVNHTITPIMEVVVPGDVNRDGTVDLTDALLTSRIISGMTPQSMVFAGADVNNDKRLGTAEMIYILQKISDLRE